MLRLTAIVRSLSMTHAGHKQCTTRTGFCKVNDAIHAVHLDPLLVLHPPHYSPLLDEEFGENRIPPLTAPNASRLVVARRMETTDIDSVLRDTLTHKTGDCILFGISRMPAIDSDGHIGTNPSDERYVVHFLAFLPFALHIHSLAFRLGLQGLEC